MDEIVCRARSGSSAPEVGTSLRVQGSFTGLCIQSGKELRCDDAETDTRVDTAAIRALGIRSMVVIPIKQDGRVIGVLAVFAPTAHAFTITHVAVLKTMADQISVLLQKERRGHEDGPVNTPPAPAPVSTLSAKPVAVTPVQIAQPAVVVKPAAPAPKPQLPVVPKIEPIRAAVAAEEISPAPAKRKKAEVEDEPKESKTDHRVSFGTLDAASGLGKRPAGMIIGLAAAAVIVVVGGLSYYMMHKPALPASPAETQSAQTANPAPSNSQPAAPVVTATGSVAQPPAETLRRPDKPSARPAAPAPQARREEAQVKHEEAPVKHEEPEPQPRHEETVALSAAPSRIPAARENASSDGATPSVALGNVPASGNISNLASPVGASTPSMVAQSELEPVSVIKRVSPIYPPVARQRMISGSVVVEAIVDKQGKIADMKLVSGPPIFRDAAFDAVKQWQFKPAKLNGQPIEQPTKIRLDFIPH
jgi:TonB family protein